MPTSDCDVPSDLDRLTRTGLLAYDLETKEWSLTTDGAQALRASRDWRFEVRDVLQLNSQPDPVAVGVLHGEGTLYPDDWFLIDGRNQLGRVLRIELVNMPEHRDRIAIAVDGPNIRPGDILRFQEPLAGGTSPVTEPETWLLVAGEQRARHRRGPCLWVEVVGWVLAASQDCSTAT